MSSDAAVRELRRQRFRLADGVVASSQRHRGKPRLHLEIHERGEFISIGEREASFLSLLNGERSFSQAVSLAARSLGADAPDEAEAMHFCTRMLHAGVLVLQEQDSARGTPVQSSSKRRRLWNPFWMQLPLFNPDRPISLLLPLVRWLFHPLWLLASSGLLVAAFFVLWTQWDRFADSSAGILARDNWLWLGATWLLLKLVHETSHALACKHYGGDVPEMGLIFILFAPMAYVDVTSSWRLRSRWQRIHIAAAGMLTEITLASIAVLVWNQVDSPQIAHRLYNVIVSAGATTLLFNINPLMRFDGYYMLSDWLGLPNLASRGSTAVRQSVLRRVFGLHLGKSKDSGSAAWTVFIYGVAAAFWRIVVSAGLMLAASVMFHGAGVVLAVLGVLMWFGQPMLMGLKWLLSMHQEDPIAVWRGATVGALGLGLVVAPFALLPNPRGASAPGVIDFAEARHIRAPGAGFIDVIHVRDGELVDAGDVLFELRNEELLNELRDVELQMQQCEVRRLAAVNSNELGEAQIEAALQVGLETRRRERQEQVNSLQVRATKPGYVIARRLHERLGTYVREGDKLCVVGDDAAKEVVLAVDQAMHRRISLGETLSIRTSSGAAFDGSISRLTPRASLTAPHPSLCAVHGGPLPNRTPVPNEDDDTDPPLVEPVLEARLKLPNRTSQSLPAGQLCYATTHNQPESIGYALYRAADKWVNDRLQAAEYEARQ